MGRICTVLMLLAAVSVFSHTWYHANSIWMPLDQAPRMPEEGYALKVYSSEGNFRLTEGYLDGSLTMRRSIEISGDTRTITEESFDDNRVVKQVYRNELLLSEEMTDDQGTQLTRYIYAPSGELEQLSHWAEGNLSYEQFIFRLPDGSLRTVFRYLDDQLLQSLVLRDDGFSMGNDQRMVRETWGEGYHIQEIFSHGVRTMKVEERSEGSKMTRVETLENPRRVSTWVYEHELITEKRVETQNRRELTTYTYDEAMRLVSETFSETSGSRTAVRHTKFLYHEKGYLQEKRISLNGELHEVNQLNPDGQLVLREIYRGGRVLITYTYE